MDKFRAMYMKEIKEVTDKYKASEQALENLRSVKRSNLGELQDDADERELLRQQREEVAMLKEQLQDQVSDRNKSRRQKIYLWGLCPGKTQTEQKPARISKF